LLRDYLPVEICATEDCIFPVLIKKGTVGIHGYKFQLMLEVQSEFYTENHCPMALQQDTKPVAKGIQDTTACFEKLVNFILG